MEDPAAFGGYGGCRTTAEASPAIGDLGAVLATVPARRVSLDTDTKVERFRVQPRRWPEKRPVRSNKKLNSMNVSFSDRINRMDRIYPY